MGRCGLGRGGDRLAVSKMTMEEPSGPERNNCHCESSRPFMGSIKVNGKPYSSSSPLSKRNAGERHEERQRGREREEPQNAAGFCLLGAGETLNGSRLETGGGNHM